MRRPRYAAYLWMSAVVIVIVALAMAASDVGMVLGETLPFYAAIFMLAWGRVLPVHSEKHFSGAATGNPSASD